MQPENYPVFCDGMKFFFFSNPKSIEDWWESWGKNQALFEYLVRDTAQPAYSRMKAYQILYHILYPDQRPKSPYEPALKHILLPQFDSKMLAELLYAYFISCNDFFDWGRPFFTTAFFCRDMAWLLGDEMLPYFYKALDNACPTPLFSSDWRESDADKRFRYADYACEYSVRIIKAYEIPEYSHCYDYETRALDVPNIKHAVEDYCAERGILLEKATETPPFEKYAAFCADMQGFYTNPVAHFEQWEQNQALFEYLVRDTAQSCEARISAYEVLYKSVYPNQGILLPQFDKKMLAKLLGDYFQSARYFNRWGAPYTRDVHFCRELALSLGGEMLAFFHKKLNDWNRAPYFSGQNWEAGYDYKYGFRYAEYAYSLICSILGINISADFPFADSFDKKQPLIVQIKPAVQTYCAERGIVLE